jgi:hypothetical protein
MDFVRSHHVLSHPDFFLPGVTTIEQQHGIGFAIA